MISNLSKFICFLFLSLLFSCGTTDSNDTKENEFQKKPDRELEAGIG
jgi:hypothetical protein